MERDPSELNEDDIFTFREKFEIDLDEQELLDCSRLPLRASTAPSGPVTEIEEFKRSADFLLIEHTIMMS